MFNVRLPLLFQKNVSGENQKFGFKYLENNYRIGTVEILLNYNKVLDSVTV